LTLTPLPSNVLQQIWSHLDSRQDQMSLRRARFKFNDASRVTRDRAVQATPDTNLRSTQADAPSLVNVGTQAGAAASSFVDVGTYTGVAYVPLPPEVLSRVFSFIETPQDHVNAGQLTMLAQQAAHCRLTTRTPRACRRHTTRPASSRRRP
jgi:hypothetical protein